ncbi:MAG: integrase arm-type DNA-binding domain-containing protein [Nautiliaceae bacterium]
MPKIATPLSDTKIKRAKPKDKMYKMFDGDGLYLEVKPTGRKVWRIKYRLSGKEKTYTIGDYPTVSLAQARAITREVKQKVLNGIDPVAERQEKKEIKKDKLFKNVIADFLDKKQKEVSEVHFKKQKGRIENYILPDLGNKEIDTITKRSIVKVIKSVPQKHTPVTKKTDKVETARRVFSLLREIYRFALHNNYTDVDVTAAIDIKAILPKREVQNFNAVLNENEFKEMYKELFKNAGHHKTYLALQFLALTALRPGNVRNLMWEWVDWDKKIITIPKEHMKIRKEFRVPLTEKLIEILNIMAMYKPNKQGLIFFGRDYNTLMSDNTFGKLIKSKGFKHTAHGFRASFATICYEKQKEHGFSAEVIETQLAHAIGNKVTRAYMRSDFLEERRKLLEWWEEFLES